MNPLQTDFLFASNSFLIGMGSCVNVGGNYFNYNSSQSPERADAAAIRSDWNVVGNDIRSAFSRAIGVGLTRGRR